MIERDKFGRFMKGHFVPKEWTEAARKVTLGKPLSSEIKVKLSKQFSGNKNPAWKGGKEGYYRRIARRMMGTQADNDYLILKGTGMDKIVHHIDGNVKNNTPNNLRILTRSEHTKLHWKQNDIRGE